MAGVAALLARSDEPTNLSAVSAETPKPDDRKRWPAAPISDRYDVRGYPSVFVLDEKGVIRGRGSNGLDPAVDKLFQALKQPASGQGTFRRGLEIAETSGQ